MALTAGGGRSAGRSGRCGSGSRRSPAARQEIDQEARDQAFERVAGRDGGRGRERARVWPDWPERGQEDRRPDPVAPQQHRREREARRRPDRPRAGIDRGEDEAGLGEREIDQARRRPNWPTKKKTTVPGDAAKASRVLGAALSEFLREGFVVVTSAPARPSPVQKTPQPPTPEKGPG